MSGVTTRINGRAQTDVLSGSRPGGSVATARPMASVLPAPAVPVKLLRFPVVRERTGLSRSTIWRLERRGEFPRHHRIAPNVVAWGEHEVSRWIEERLGADASVDLEPALAGGGRLR
jgi:prophage regulatory protein